MSMNIFGIFPRKSDPGGVTPDIVDRNQVQGIREKGNNLIGKIYRSAQEKVQSILSSVSTEPHNVLSQSVPTSGGVMSRIRQRVGSIVSSFDGKIKGATKMAAQAGLTVGLATAAQTGGAHPCPPTPHTKATTTHTPKLHHADGNSAKFKEIAEANGKIVDHLLEMKLALEGKRAALANYGIRPGIGPGYSVSFEDHTKEQNRSINIISQQIQKISEQNKKRQSSHPSKSKKSEHHPSVSKGVASKNTPTTTPKGGAGVVPPPLGQGASAPISKSGVSTPVQRASQPIPATSQPASAASTPIGFFGSLGQKTNPVPPEDDAIPPTAGSPSDLTHPVIQRISDFMQKVRDKIFPNQSTSTSPNTSVSDTNTPPGSHDERVRPPMAPPPNSPPYSTRFSYMDVTPHTVVGKSTDIFGALASTWNLSDPTLPVFSLLPYSINYIKKTETHSPIDPDRAAISSIFQKNTPPPVVSKKPKSKKPQVSRHTDVNNDIVTPELVQKHIDIVNKEFIALNKNHPLKNARIRQASVIVKKKEGEILSIRIFVTINGRSGYFTVPLSTISGDPRVSSEALFDWAKSKSETWSKQKTAVKTEASKSKLEKKK